MTKKEYDEERINNSLGIIEKLESENKELKEHIERYAAFCVECDREKLPLLKYDDWNSEIIKLLK